MVPFFLSFICFPILKNSYLLCASVCLELGIWNNVRIGSGLGRVGGLGEKTRMRNRNAKEALTMQCRPKSRGKKSKREPVFACGCRRSPSTSPQGTEIRGGIIASHLPSSIRFMKSAGSDQFRSYHNQCTRPKKKKKEWNFLWAHYLKKKTHFGGSGQLGRKRLLLSEKWVSTGSRDNESNN